jgi:hypothetical protein
MTDPWLGPNSSMSFGGPADKVVVEILIYGLIYFHFVPPVRYSRSSL